MSQHVVIVLKVKNRLGKKSLVAQMIYIETGNEKIWRFLISGQDSKLSIIGSKNTFLTSNVSR